VTAVELMDGDILELSKGNMEQQKNRFFVDGDPAALLITELRAENKDDLDRKAAELEHDLMDSGLVYKCTRVYGTDVAKVWNLRKAGLGILGGMKGDAKPMGVIEDTAVAAYRLPAYMKDFRALLDKLDARCVFYGHISTGELHLRPILNLKTHEGRTLFRTLAHETALLVKKHRGSISGEHGDGRLRGEFIPLLYGDEAYRLMREVKQCWDPDGLLNRHKIVDTLPMDSMLRFEEDHRQGTIEHRLQTSDFRPQTSDFRPQTSDFRPQTTDFRPQTTDFRPQTSDFRPQTSDFRPQTTDLRLQTSDFRLQTTDFRPQTTDFRLQTSDDETYFNWKAAFDECTAPGATGARSQTHALICTIEQCNGAGDCRKSNIIGGTMCPAYKVSGDELKTTRARANVLREVLTRDTECSMPSVQWSMIKEILDSCLACKGCRSECPSNVDMTRLRAEMLQQYYDRHGTPLRSWLVARMAQMEEMGRCVRPLYNFAATWKPSAAIIKRVVKFAPERSIPTLSKHTMRQLVKEERGERKEERGERKEEREKRKVLLFADEFTNQQEAELGLMFAKLLMRLGYQVEIPNLLESGRAAISKGCLKRAKVIAEENVKRLSSLFNSQSSICNSQSSMFNLVGIEPSAILTFRDEYPDLVPAEMRNEAQKIGKQCLLYDEFLKQEIDNGHISAEAFKADEMDIWLHGHCHQKALVGVEKTVEVLQTLLKGATVHTIPSGCCGMAGSFGYEKEHYKTSLEIGEMVLFPAIRKIEDERLKSEHCVPAFVAAPGTSCRQQIFDGTGVKAVHPIEILYKYLT
jgi:Fe-S oxidoreductase